MTDKHLNNSPEIWKAIPGFLGYEISDQGRVRSYYRQLGQAGGGARWVLADTPQRILRPSYQGGYPQVNLWKDGEKYHYFVHQLVLTVFVGPCPPDHECCHGDGKRSHNWLTNLEWGTKSKNYQDRHGHGTDNTGEKNGRTIVTENQVREIRELYPQGYTLKELGEMFGVHFSTIAAIVKRRNWKHI